MVSAPITSWQIDWEKPERDSIFLGSKITAMTVATKLKDVSSLEEKPWQT